MEATAERRTSRIDLRMTGEQRRMIDEAAALCGMSISQWSLDRLLASARRDVQDATTMRLSAEAFDEFSRLLEEPPSPAFEKFVAEKSIWE